MARFSNFFHESSKIDNMETILKNCENILHYSFEWKSQDLCLKDPHLSLYKLNELFMNRKEKNLIHHNAVELRVRMLNKQPMNGMLEQTLIRRFMKLILL
ncbi:CLUMA_CG008859, isoform A [Clunio marinus]|uniref:CLUMA_CG008859, isoform A n=1 Tax=Clunio marinus TaxID=568069 RepID=A0A1J1I4J7_9DIPT|nr:CLUMA_CG008859, isoform A [Clunio marinus]